MPRLPQDEIAQVASGDEQESPTHLEPVEEIHRASQARGIQTAKDAGPDGDTLPFRPVRRPPMALLGILYDDHEEGEWLRICTDSFVIGRADGDLVIPHDAMMSSRHAEISRRADRGRYRWVLSDLKSTNGTFVRVASAVLKHGQEILLGGRRYRFDAAAQHQAAPRPMATDSSGEQGGGTRGWKNTSSADLLPSLVEITPEGEGQRILLTKPDSWIGRDAKRCAVAFADDLLLSPRHARLHRDTKGHWLLENAGSRNGTWIRINKLPLDGTCQFQLGEQRLIFKSLQ